MRKARIIRLLRLSATGAILLQAGGCDLGMLNSLVQTVFLGITAAGSVAILQNI